MRSISIGPSSDSKTILPSCGSGASARRISWVHVAGADACAGQNEQTVLRQEIPEFVHQRENRVRAAIHDGAAADLHDLQPGEEPDWTLVGDRASELAVEESLARERRGDMLDFVGGVGHWR